MSSMRQPINRQEDRTADQKCKPPLFLIPNSLRGDSKNLLKSPNGKSLLFSLEDTTAGVESEIQAVVIGNSNQVDLPLSIKASNYYKNVVKKAKTGDSPQHVLTSLEDFLEDNEKEIWENSWVRFPENVLSDYACEVFQTDLLADKKHPEAGNRSDLSQFCFQQDGESYIRIPVSYLLKLALADATSKATSHPTIREIARKLMGHFLNDNTSPETLSFYTVPLSKRFDKGKGIAEETLLRYLLCQLLVQYANKQFKLTASGQTARVYFAPNPPIHQRKLNELIPDSFYRELFMSPCLSGWDKGEDKHHYMGFCHRVLSNSQLNAIVKLKEAGIIITNLVVLPNTSNTSLANNGTHVSLGSRRLSRLLADPQSGFSKVEEKYYGDLAIKIIEHFLPLFVGNYSGSPYRLDFWDFHPEKVLGYLPHQLDFTHLRMIWRRWKKKADLKFLGRRFTPFGPNWFDRFFSRAFGIKGDFVSDYRLVDYFVSLLSTEQSPALNGKLGNDEQLKKDLSSMGVFDTSMATYLLYRLRQFDKIGFSGFEGRYYSQFENVREDLGEAVNLQALISALAYKYIVSDKVHHTDIPDDPFIESERRQIFFGAAIGIPTFFVSKNTHNRFLKRIVEKAERTRFSRRYSGYIRIHNKEYQCALLKVLKEDAGDLIEMMDMEATIADLQHRLDDPKNASAFGKLTRGILDEAGTSEPMKMSGEDFNITAERYYRETLRKKQMNEALDILKRDAGRQNSVSSTVSADESLIKSVLHDKSAGDFIDAVKQDLLKETLPEEQLLSLIHLMLLVVEHNKQQTSEATFNN